ncbi:hypothetical protein [Saccharothrix xinjiangensis]|uniref:Helix-turn-helix protein n=1 Tax=Saccharothrix xinjiangensis TaxID=204798 RepID=A0ABV9XSV8_9PSEU
MAERREERRLRPADVFNRAIAKLLTEHRARATADFQQALEEGRLLAWPLYTEVLFGLGLDLDRANAVKARYRAAAESTVDRSRPESAPVRSMEDVELRARNPAEFTELLRTVQGRSGLTPPGIGRSAGIPRSQVYSMTRSGRLPTKRAQLESFLVVCGLPEAQVRLVMNLWVELRQRKRDRAAVLGSLVEPELWRSKWLDPPDVVVAGVVTGTPGTGKSALLARLVRESTEPPARRRVLVVSGSHDQTHSWIRRLEGLANGDDDPPDPLPAAPRRT